ncbi:MAG: CBS domain-containing protein [Methanobacteriota archaeon]|nr:MAG: CBS domain-containing protein [Euryarchaeota archaeon]
MDVPRVLGVPQVPAAPAVRRGGPADPVGLRGGDGRIRDPRDGVSFQTISPLPPRGLGLVFVRDVMTRQVIVIDPDRTIADAAKRMAAKKIGGLVVVEHGRPIGLLTDRDILWNVTAKGKNPSRVLVREIMTSPVATVSPLTTLRAAARVMLEQKTRWIVVTRLENVEGIVTASDLTQGFLEAFARASKRGILSK